MFRWSNMFGCSLAFALISLPEYFLTSRTASKKEKKSKWNNFYDPPCSFQFYGLILLQHPSKVTSGMQLSLARLVLWHVKMPAMQRVHSLTFLKLSVSKTFELLPAVSTKVSRNNLTNLMRSLTEEKNDEYYDHREKHFVPELRHPAPDPQLENTLPSANTRHRHMCNSMSPYSLTIQAYDHNPWPCCGHTNLLAEMKGKQRKMRITISA